MVRPAALLMAYFGAGFGALRAYPGGRTSKKQAGATGERPPSGIGRLSQGDGQKKMIRRSCGIHRRLPKTAGMARMAAIALLLIASATAAPAAEKDKPRVCLSKSEQKAAISNGQAVTLAQAIRSIRGSVRGRGAREVVNAQLCREEKGLVYLLTVLARDGKVTHMTVDATSGKVVDAL
jgi:uncharacterized membrane protein YkoI